MKHAFAFLVLLLSSIATAADTYTELYVEPAATNASNINGGSSRDRKFQRTNGQWNSATRTFTATGDTLNTAWIGEVACVIADGGTTGAYFAVVTAVDNTAKTITLSSSRVVGTAPSTSATGRTITIGGAWTGMSGATTFPFSITTWHSLKDTSTRARINLCGSFSATSTLSHNSNSVPLRGYSTTPGDGGLATIAYTGSANTDTLQLATAAYVYEFDSLWLKNQTTFSGATFSSAAIRETATSDQAFIVCRNCRFSDTQGPAIVVGSGTYDPCVVLIGCEFFDCGKGSGLTASYGQCIYVATETKLICEQCLFHDNQSSYGGGAVLSSGFAHFNECVFDNNRIAIRKATEQFTATRCVFFGNTTAISGDNGPESYMNVISDSVFEGNTTCFVKDSHTTGRDMLLRNCRYYNNTTKLGTNAGTPIEIAGDDLTQSPFVDAANGDFRTRLTPLRNAINGTLLQSSSYYSKSTRFRRDIGIGASNPYQIGQ